jgi:hypothetical protein
MEGLQLKINNKIFKLVFGLKVFRILGAKWNLPGLNEVFARIQCLDSKDKNLTFEAMDVLEDLLTAGIEAGNNPDYVPGNISILDEFFKDPNAIKQLTNALVSSMPRQQVEELGKSKATRKVKK